MEASYVSDASAEARGFWATAERLPSRTALIDSDGTRWTYAELLSLVNRYSHLFRARGLEVGDHLASIVHNTVDAYAISLAAAQTGIYHTPVNWHLTAPECAYVIADSQAKLLIGHVRFAGVAIAAAREAGLAADRLLSLGGPIKGFTDLRAACADLSPELPQNRSFGPTQYYTSGTTGYPKGVLSVPAGREMHNYTYPSLEAFLDAMGFSAESVFLVQGPLYHAGPFAYSVQVLHRGGQVIVMDRWTPEGALAQLSEHRVTATFMVPTMFHRVLDLPEDDRTGHDLSALRMVVHSAAMCPVPVKRRMLEWLGPLLFEVYGGSEALVSTCLPQEWLAHPGTVGRAEQSQVKILDEATGDECEPGDIGLVFFYAPEVSYFGDAAKTDDSHRGDLMTLGDMGYVSPEGWLYLSDRRADLIVSGGVNIYPAEIENVLLEHPGVLDVAVIGVPNAEWGHEVKAVVCQQPGVDVDEAQLLEFAAARLARFKHPRSVEFVDELPRTEAGKLYRRRLRERYLGSPAKPADGTTQPG